METTKDFDQRAELEKLNAKYTKKYAVSMTVEETSGLLVTAKTDVAKAKVDEALAGDILYAQAHLGEYNKIVSTTSDGDARAKAKSAYEHALRQAKKSYGINVYRFKGAYSLTDKEFTEYKPLLDAEFYKFEDENYDAAGKLDKAHIHRLECECRVVALSDKLVVLVTR